MSLRQRLERLTEPQFAQLLQAYSDRTGFNPNELPGASTSLVERVLALYSAAERRRHDGELEACVCLIEGVGTSRHNLPPLVDCFVGRDDEVGRIHELLRPGSIVSLAGVRPPGSVVGIAGVGKSQLAIAYAVRYLASYRTVLWVDAGARGFVQELARAAPLLGVAERDDKIEQAMAVRAALQEGGPHLLVLDNVGPDKTWRSWVPHGPASRVLITTRHRLPSVTEIPVDVLPHDQAMQLLCGEHAYDGDELRAAEALCVEFGYLTLALAVARALLDTTETPVSLLVWVRSVGTIEWSEAVDEDILPFLKNPSLSRLFEVSFARVATEEPTGGLARAMLLVGGWFAPVRVAEELLVDAAQRYGGDACEAWRRRQASDRLVRTGLAFREDGGLRIHRLVQAWLRRMGGEEASRAHLDALSHLSKYTDTEIFALHALEPHRAHLREAAASLDASADSEHYWIALRLVQHLKYHALYEDALDRCREALETCSSKEIRCYLLNEQGQVLEDLARYEEGLASLHASLELLIQVFGREHEETAVTLDAIGHSLFALGRYEEALEHYQQALSIERKTRGEDHAFTGISHGNIARAYDYLGRYEEALDSYRTSLAVVEAALGGEHPEVATCLGNLGVALRNLGRYEEALMVLRKALAIRERTIGEKHPSTATARNNVARVLLLTGDPEAALEPLRQALEVQESVLGPEHPDTSATHLNLSLALTTLGQRKEALVHAQRAVEVDSRAHGREHPETALSLHGVAQVLQDLGDFEAALETYAEVVSIQEKVVGADHPDTLLSRFNRGELLAGTGHEEGMAEMLEATARLEAVLGQKHPDVVQMREALSGAASRSRRM